MFTSSSSGFLRMCRKKWSCLCCISRISRSRFTFLMSNLLSTSQLRSPRIITFKPCSRESTSFPLRFSRKSIGASGAETILFSCTVPSPKAVENFNQRMKTIVRARMLRWIPLPLLCVPRCCLNVIYPGACISASHTEGFSHVSEIVMISWLVTIFSVR